MTMSTIADIRAQIETDREAYRLANEANRQTAEAVQKASDKVKASQDALSTAICEGAKPCPDCDGTERLHGMIQPTSDGASEVFEVGCTSCGWFMHSDGTARDHSARASRANHAVEIWNEQDPNSWKTKPRARFTDEEWAALKPRSKK
jgi:hypothetical protein